MLGTVASTTGGQREPTPTKRLIDLGYVVLLEPWACPFNDDRTRVVHLDEGCDFLGFNIRRYHGKLLTKPSKAALRGIRKRLTDEVSALRAANTEAVVAGLNPITKGTTVMPCVRTAAGWRYAPVSSLAGWSPAGWTFGSSWVPSRSDERSWPPVSRKAPSAW
ncbi:hypothetical protein [Streptomyces hainanensis]|uniref:hypothetical protein n=1 Tax=Streptomyces hainanensis TaxID=402648 RepID=UPI001A9F5E14|nr:hypothetical protein [Streptomyces hainanensis]